MQKSSPGGKVEPQTLVRRVVARHLSGAPLTDFHSLGSDGNSTVGWGLEKNREKLEKTTKFFEARKDDWAILVRPLTVEASELEAYVKSNPKLKRSKIIVVSSSQMGGDETAPEWVAIHDIVGHAIARTLSFPFVWALHAVLPRPYKVSSDPKDYGPDVYAGVFFHANLRKLVDDATSFYLEAFLNPEGKAGVYRANWAAQSLSDALQELKMLNLRRPEDLNPKNVSTQIQAQVVEVMREVANWSSGFKPGVPKQVTLW